MSGNVVRSQDVTGRLQSLWWVPLAFVAGVLVILLGTPIIVNFRVRRLRNELAEGSDAARVLVNDLEVAFATQLLLQEKSHGIPEPHYAAAVAAARLRERRDELALDSVASRVGPDVVERVTALRTIARTWPTQRAAGLGTADTTSDVLAAADQLYLYLSTVSQTQRAHIQAMERLDVLSAMILAPLALAAAVVLYGMGRHILFLAHTAEERTGALTNVLQQKAALVRGVTHDIKNPIGAAYGYGELLEDGVVGPLTAEQRGMVRRIQSLLTVSISTVNDLLHLYRDESETLTVEPVVTDVTHLVADVVSDFQAAAGAARVSLAVEPSPAPTVVSTDPTRVRQILSNLVSNAVKYTPSGGHVWVRVRPPGVTEPKVAIEVCDTGPGIPVAYRDQIFEEFFRVPSTEAVPGTGIGLSISRRLARLLGGDLTVADGPEGGSVFSLWLPVG